MSHQPSTAESLKNSASNAYSAVVNTVVPSSSSQNTGEDYDPNKNAANFAKDTHGNTFKKGDYKDQLNQAAHGGTKQPEKGESYVEKACSYIPGVSSLQQAAFEQGEPNNEPKLDGPPNRLDHDVQVEQFLRKQYHSRSGDGMPNPGDKS